MFYAVANTILRQVGATITPVVPFIWNLNTNKWNQETRFWASATVWEDVATEWENEINNWN